MSTEIVSRAPTALQEVLPSCHQTATVEDRPAEGRAGWIVIGLFFVAFLGFAAFVRMDAAAYAEGNVAVSGSRQVVQHRDGGTVTALHVREGQQVKAGQVLIELAGAEVAANESAAATEIIHLLAQRARLEAERRGERAVPIPDEFSMFTGDERAEAVEALKLQQIELQTRRAAVAAQKQVLVQQSAQLRQRIAGLGKQIETNEEQRALFEDELAGMRELAKKGFASTNRVRALERARAQVDGETASLAAGASSAREQIGEQRMQALTLDAQKMQEVSQQLSETIDRIGVALPKWQALKRQLENTRIRATASGQVVGLTVMTVGAVVAPGQKLLEIVPDQARLVIEMMVSPGDADDVRVGQTAEVRFTSLHDRNLPVFNGTVSRISADSFTDEHTGRRYFTGQITVTDEDLSKIAKLRGAGNGLKAGLPAEVLIPLRQRTLLQYLLAPLTSAMWRSGHEQ